MISKLFYRTFGRREGHFALLAAAVFYLFFSNSIPLIPQKFATYKGDYLLAFFQILRKETFVFISLFLLFYSFTINVYIRYILTALVFVCSAVATYYAVMLGTIVTLKWCAKSSKPTTMTSQKLPAIRS